MYPSKIRISTSSWQLLHRCEREYQLVELLTGASGEEHSPIFSFGHSWGEGVMEYLQTGSLDAAIWRSFLSYWPFLEDAKKMRLEEFVYHGLMAAKGKLDQIRAEWEVAIFNGKPARELGFHIDINDRFYFESAIDGVLKKKSDEPRYAIVENKHTMSWLDDITPMFKNSSQGLMYSIVIDAMTQQTLGDYTLNYFIGQFKSSTPDRPVIHFYPWRKTLLDRLNMFYALGMDVQRLTQMLELNLFPMRGHSCLRYNSPCPFFGTCELRANDTPKTDEYVLKNKTEHIKEVEASIAFRYTLDDIIKDHIAKAQEEMIR